jgi:hypothetical protein
MKVVEPTQHGLAMRHRRGLVVLTPTRLAGHRVHPRRRTRPTRSREVIVGVPPMRPGRLDRYLQPAAEITSLDPSRLVPTHPDRRQESEPAQQIHPVGPLRRFSFTASRRASADEFLICVADPRKGWDPLVVCVVASFRPPCPGAVDRSRGRGGAPAAQRGRTTSTPTRIRRIIGRRRVRRKVVWLKPSGASGARTWGGRRAGCAGAQPDP